MRVTVLPYVREGCSLLLYFLTSFFQSSLLINMTSSYDSSYTRSFLLPLLSSLPPPLTSQLTSRQAPTHALHCILRCHYSSPMFIPTSSAHNHSPLNSNQHFYYCFYLSDTGADSYKNPRPMILTVVDVAGLCVMTIPSRWLDLDQPVLTKIELRDYNTSIVGLTLLVIRTEFIHDVRFRSNSTGLLFSYYFITPIILPPLSFFSSVFLFFFSSLSLLYFLSSFLSIDCKSFFSALPIQCCHTSDFFRQILTF